MADRISGTSGTLQGKTVILGVTGSIAAYKAASLASLLVKNGADVEVLMTKNACNIINPITFETLTGHKCYVDTFDRNFEFNVNHVSLAKRADVFMIAPATANVIAKVANGLADDMLTTTFLACQCTKIISPAMNTAMFNNPITQDNLEKCRRFGMQIVEPATGHLACGDDGKGKMPEPEVLLEYIIAACTEKDLAGKKILVTAGPTRESLDPVRFITNHSSGKMGYEIAKAASYRGASVVLVSGPCSQTEPLFAKTVHVESALDMFNAVKENFPECDAVVKAAAVADYRPCSVSDEKIKKSSDGSDLTLKLERTDDILAWLGQNKKSGQFLCGFSMETQNMLENSKAKLTKKNLDMIVANNLKTEGAGFGVDTNVVTFIKPDSVQELPCMTKRQVAHKLLDEIFSKKN